MTDLDEAAAIQVYTAPHARSRRPVRLELAVGAIAIGVLAAGGSRLAGSSSGTPQDALRAAAGAYDDVIVGRAPAKDILKYVAASCSAQIRQAALAAPALTRVLAPGVTGFEITRVSVEGAAGQVWTVPTGPGATAFKNILDVADGTGPGQSWKLEDGHWVRANC